MNKDIATEVLMQAYEKSYTQLFESMKSSGEITPELEADFLEFFREFRKKVEATGGLSVKTMLEEFPQNKWIPIYLSFCQGTGKKRDKNMEKRWEKISNSAEFEAEYRKIKKGENLQ